MKQIQREELYNLLWKKPISQVAEDIDFDTTLLRKVCKDNLIPLPKNGYWTKLKHNKPVVKKELSVSDGDYEINLSKYIQEHQEYFKYRLEQRIIEIKEQLPLYGKWQRNYLSRTH